MKGLDLADGLMLLGKNVVMANAEKIAGAVYRNGTKAYKRFLVESGQAFVDYLDNAIDRFSKVKTILYNHAPVGIYDFYVDVNLLNQRTKQTIMADTVLKVLSQGRHITLLGTGGSGKSTLLKHLFLSTIRHTELIPIFFQLREVNQHDLPLLDCIYKSLTLSGFSLAMIEFERGLKAGCFVIFLDGFDEITDSHKTDYSTQIVELAEKYKLNYFIVSSRHTDQYFIGWNRFTTLTMLPLEKTQAMELISKIDYQPDVKGKFALELDDSLYDAHQSFASNPLLLCIMLLTYVQNAAIPNKIHLFYKYAFEALYAQHDATKGMYKRQFKTQLASDDFKNVLSVTSAVSYVEGLFEFDAEQLHECINLAKELYPDLEFVTEEFKGDLLEAVCIIIQDGLKYIFSHRSFQEYFTARYISSLDGDEQLQFIKRLFIDRPQSIMSDKVVEILHEMDKHAFERNIALPLLAEIRDNFARIVDHEKRYIAYMSIPFSGVGFYYGHHDDEDEEDDTLQDPLVSFWFKDDNSQNTRLWYLYFLRFIHSKYGTSYPEPTIFVDSVHSIDLIRQALGITDDLDPNNSNIQLLFSDVPIHTHLSREILGHSSTYITQLEFGINFIEQLRIAHQKKMNVREMFLKSKLFSETASTLQDD